LRVPHAYHATDTAEPHGHANANATSSIRRSDRARTKVQDVYGMVSRACRFVSSAIFLLLPRPHGSAERSRQVARSILAKKCVPTSRTRAYKTCSYSCSCVAGRDMVRSGRIGVLTGATSQRGPAPTGRFVWRHDVRFGHDAMVSSHRLPDGAGATEQTTIG